LLDIAGLDGSPKKRSAAGFPPFGRVLRVLSLRRNNLALVMRS
jgi:hypothetical protein